MKKNQGSLDLLRSSAISKRKIVLSKFLLLVFYAILYYILVNIFFIIVMSISGMPFYNGFLSIYRVFDGNPISYIGLSIFYSKFYCLFI